jgi:hypothetical protein
MQKRTMLGALAMVVAGAAAAQNAPQPGPADPKARTQPAEYRSAFTDYRRYSEPEIADWRAVNDEVARVGGHLGIVRGQREDDKGRPKPPAHGMHNK